MRRVRLVHWNETEAKERAARLRAAGYQAEYARFGPGAFRKLRARRPAAVVIDLGRLPSHGRAVACELRAAKATRALPLVFVDGAKEKVAAIREILPDAVYTTWRGIRGALERAIARPPASPVVPVSLSGYGGTPLPRKLGIAAGSVVALVGAPPDFEETLGALPAGVTLGRGARGKPDLVLWFARSQAELRRRVQRLGRVAGRGGLWIAWPKQASGVKSDLTQPVVRKIGLGAGLVDYKVCAIDATWSGLRFTPRRAR